MPKFDIEIKSDWTLAVSSQANGSVIGLPAGIAFYWAIQEDGRPGTDYENYRYHDGMEPFSVILNTDLDLWLATRRMAVNTVIERPAWGDTTGELALTVARQAEELAAGAVTLLQAVYPFASRAEAIAATIAPEISYIDVAGLRYVTDAGGTALTTAGGRNWSPASDTAYPEHWGLLPSAPDASPLFQLALDWAAADPNRKIVDRFVGTCTFGSGLAVNGNVNVDQGVARYVVNHAGSFLTAHGTPTYTPVALSAAYVVGATTMTLSAPLPSAPKRGDWLRIVSDAINPRDRTNIGSSTKYRVQEYFQAGQGSTTTNIVLARPLRFVEGMNEAETTVINSYTTARNTRVTPLNQASKFQWRGGSITYAAGHEVEARTFFVTAYLGPRFDGVEIFGAIGTAIYLNGTVDAVVSKCRIGDLPDSETFTSRGYGVCDGGLNTLVEDCFFGKCRHAYTTLRVTLADGTNSVFSSGNTVGSKVVRCTSTECTSTHFDTHHGSCDIDFIDCYAEGGGEAGFGVRSDGHKVINCRTFATRTGFRSLVEVEAVAGKLERYATSATIQGCHFQSREEPINARNSKITIRDSVLESPILRQLQSINSQVVIAGDVTVKASTLNGALPLSTPGTGTPDSGAIFADPSGGTWYAGTSSVEVLPSATLTVDMSAFGSAIGSIMTPLLGGTIRVWGTLRVRAPSPATLISQSATRLVTSSQSRLEVMSDGLGLGTAAGKFIAYRSDGTAA